MPDMNLADAKLTDQVSRYKIDGHENDGHETDGHEIGGQDIYRLKIDYSAVCNYFLNNNTTQDLQQQSKVYNMLYHV